MSANCTLLASCLLNLMRMDGANRNPGFTSIRIGKKLPNRSKRKKTKSSETKFSSARGEPGGNLVHSMKREIR